jgi:putative FmdB family regulatory protein
MPTYDFLCANGHKFEQFFKMSEVPSSLECPECCQEAERRISGGAGLMFKGSGFYLTDYGKNAHRKPEPEKKSEGKSDSKSESKSETKSETKSDSSSASKPAKPSSSE